jgi:hypothetical protein
MPKKSHLWVWEINIVKYLVKLLNIPIHYGFAPTQWCTSIMVMIEKDPGNPRIEHLRVIHLCEADYNLCLKLLWGKQMVYQGEDNNCFGEQQHGLQPWWSFLTTNHAVACRTEHVCDTSWAGRLFIQTFRWISYFTYEPALALPTTCQNLFVHKMMCTMASGPLPPTIPFAALIMVGKWRFLFYHFDVSHQKVAS